MKTTCVILVLLFLAQNPAKKPDRSNAQGQNQANDAGGSLRQAEPVTVNCNQSAETIAEHNGKETPKWYATVEWANWALVFVAGITGYLIWIQAKETARATQAMRDSLPLQKSAADAALLNAQAVINAERPWLMIEKIDDPYLEPWEMPPRTTIDEFPLPRPQSELRLSHCMFYIKNFGNTPAKLTAWRYELLIGDSWAAPPETDLWQHQGRNDSPFAIAANGTLAQPAELVGGVVAIKQRDELLVSKVSTLWLCGIVHYMDAFEKAHETRFCWLYQTHTNAPRPYWQLGGPREYNQTT